MAFPRKRSGLNGEKARSNRRIVVSFADLKSLTDIVIRAKAGIHQENP